MHQRSGDIRAVGLILRKIERPLHRATHAACIRGDEQHLRAVFHTFAYPDAGMPGSAPSERVYWGMGVSTVGQVKITQRIVSRRSIVTR